MIPENKKRRFMLLTIITPVSKNIHETLTRIYYLNGGY